MSDVFAGVAILPARGTAAATLPRVLGGSGCCGRHSVAVGSDAGFVPDAVTGTAFRVVGTGFRAVGAAFRAVGAIGVMVGYHKAAI